MPNYTNSPLVGYTRLVNKHSGQRTHCIDRITPHCVVGQVTAARLKEIFSGTRDVSSNYGIALDGLEAWKAAYDLPIENESQKDINV